MDISVSFHRLLQHSHFGPLQLFVLGAVLTVFAREHADYISVKVEGPFKFGHYRYRDARFSRECCRWQRVWRNWRF